jgi:hypothetical protein
VEAEYHAVNSRRNNTPKNYFRDPNNQSICSSSIKAKVIVAWVGQRLGQDLGIIMHFREKTVTNAGWRNWLARETVNLEVVGSSPTLAAFFLSYYIVLLQKFSMCYIFAWLNIQPS